MQIPRKKAIELRSRNFPLRSSNDSPAAAIFKISALPTELPGSRTALQLDRNAVGADDARLGRRHIWPCCHPNDTDGSLPALKQECARIFSLGGKPPWRNVTLLVVPD